MKSFAESAAGAISSWGHHPDCGAREDLGCAGEALNRLGDLRRGVRDWLSGTSGTSVLTELSSVHDSIALPKGRFGRVALDPASEESARRSEEIDDEIESIRCSPPTHLHEWVNALATIAEKVQCLAEIERQRLTDLTEARADSNASGREWSAQMPEPADNHFSVLNLRGLAQRLDHGRR